MLAKFPIYFLDGGAGSRQPISHSIPCFVQNTPLFLVCPLNAHLFLGSHKNDSDIPFPTLLQIGIQFHFQVPIPTLSHIQMASSCHHLKVKTTLHPNNKKGGEGPPAISHYFLSKISYWCHIPKSLLLMGTKVPTPWARHLLRFSLFLLLLSRWQAEAFGCNWGLHSTHPLPGDVVVRLLKDNGFNKVKLFEAMPWALHALGHSGIQVMLGIPNEFLVPLASSVRVAEQWVTRNVSTYISKYGVDIRYVAVGNEPFLKTYKGKYQQTTFPALQNIQAALIKAGLSHQVKVTIPLNAAVYQSESGLPSGGDFRSDIHDLMVRIVRFLRDNGGPLTINIYPFLSLYADPHFPLDYAFFGSGASPVVDGPISYTNVFEANYDTLIAALDKNGFSNMQVIVGEIGWPTDGNKNANPDYARRFNQGLVNRIMQRTGTPRRPSSPPDVYLFGLLDEDAKSIKPGDFERHWGLFAFDGSLKYPLVLANGRPLTPARGVSYLPRQWCVMSPSASVADALLPESLNYACTYADCTSLGYGSSCGGLDLRSNASYAFNRYYQTMNQQKGACGFGNLSVITAADPSPAGQPRCRFEVMIDVRRGGQQQRGGGVPSSAPHRGSGLTVGLLAAVVVVMWVWMFAGGC